MSAVAVAGGGPSGPELRGQSRGSIVCFGPFRLDLEEERLWNGERELRLRRKPFAILRYLALHPRRLVTYFELTQAVWGKVAISESLLRTHVHALRRALGEPIIETVAGRGYRFLQNGAPRLGLVHPVEATVFGAPCVPLGASHAEALERLAAILAASSPEARVIVIVGEPPLAVPEDAAETLRKGRT